MRINIKNLFVLKMDKRTTLNSTLFKNMFSINAYNEYYLKMMFVNNGIFTNSIKYSIQGSYYKSITNLPYSEVNLMLDTDSPIIGLIEGIYKNCESRILEEQEIYNKVLNINDIENIIRMEQRKILETNKETVLYNNILNESYEKMGFIRNKINLYL